MTIIDVFQDRLAMFWWYHLPLAGSRISHNIAVILSEGAYWSAWRSIAAVLPILAFLAGLLSGWGRLGNADVVFTESPLILIATILSGLLGGQIGFWFVIGFVVGDFALYNHPFARFARDFERSFAFRSALVIAYVGMGMLAVGLPVLLRTLRAQWQALQGWSADVIFVLDTLLSALVAAAFTFLYLQALPILVRPVFTWIGRQPTVDAMFSLQEQPWLFAVTAFGVTVFRILVEYVSVTSDPESIQKLADALDEQRETGLWERIPRVIRIPIESFVIVVLISGLLTDWSSAIVPFLVLVGVGYTRWFLSVRFKAWPRFMSRIPAILRIAGMVIATYFLSTLILPGRLRQDSFEPLVWALLASLMVAAILFPEPQPTTQGGAIP